MVSERRKRPQKALTRKDFRYKRDWRYNQDIEREEHKFEEDLREEFEEDDDSLIESGLMLLAGVFMSFVKLIELGESSVGVPLADIEIVVKYLFSFLAVAGVNAIGNQMATEKGKKIRITGRVLKYITYFVFAALFYFLVSTN